MKKTLINRKEGPKVEIEGGLVSKTFIKNFPEELRKHEWCYEAFSQCKEAYYPEIVNAKCRGESGTITTKYIAELVSVRSIFLSLMKAKTNDLSVFAKAGRALSTLHTAAWPGEKCIHESMPQLNVQVPNYVAKEAPVLLHGDYGFSNVLWSAKCQKLVVIDASPNYYVTYHPLQVGDRYVDLATFVGCLCGRVPASQFLFMRWYRAAACVKSFCEAYSQACAISIESKPLFSFARAIGNAYFTYKYDYTPLRLVAKLWYCHLVNYTFKQYERQTNRL